MAVPVVPWNVESILWALPVFPGWHLHPANQPRLRRQPGRAGARCCKSVLCHHKSNPHLQRVQHKFLQLVLVDTEFVHLYGSFFFVLWSKNRLKYVLWGFLLFSVLKCCLLLSLLNWMVLSVSVVGALVLFPLCGPDHGHGCVPRALHRRRLHVAFLQAVAWEANYFGWHGIGWPWSP